MSKWWRTFLALVLVPVLVAGGFLWGTWNANDRLRKVEAAVVNLDEAVTIEDQVVPLGRQLSAALVDGDKYQNFTWVLADEAHAYPGLQSGRYAAVVVIPKNFSAAATSYGNEDPRTAEQATIQVLTSPVAGIADGSLGNVLAAAAARTLNGMLTEAYLDRIYLGFNDTGKQFRTVADAAAELADGATKLNNGAFQSWDGAAKLSDGLDLLAANAGKLTAGAGQSASGAGKLAAGLAEMKAQTRTLPADTRQLADGVAQYTAGVGLLITEVEASNASLPALVGGVGDLADGAAQLSSGLRAYRGAMGGIAADPASSGVPCPAGFTAEQCQAYYAGLATGAGIAASQIAGAVDGAAGLDAGLGQLETQLQAMTPTPQEAQEAAAQLALLKAAGPQLAAGTADLADGLPALTGGIAQAATGSAKLAAGLKEFAAGLKQYAGGVGQAASGTGELADGLAQLSDGAHQLADGSGQLADGLAEGAGKVPRFTSAERETLAQVVASPVQTSSLDTVVTPAFSWVSLLLVLSLWLGALATFAVVRAINRRIVLSTKSTGALIWESLSPGLAVAAAQAVALTVIGVAALGLALPKAATMAGLLVLAGAAFVVVNHALVGWLGGGGRLIAVLAAVAAAVSAVTSSVPAVFDAVRPFSPVTPALDAIRSLLTDSAGTATSVAGLIGWLVAGLLASSLAVLRHRSVDAGRAFARG